MAWDLAISEHGDLIFAGNRDLAGVSGSDLIEQRMRLRLKLHRGSWVYDADGNLGSNLWRLIGMRPQDANAAVNALVREALRPMANEINVADVKVYRVDKSGVPTVDTDPSFTGIQIVVLYQITGGNEGVVASSDVSQLTILIPLFTGGEE